MVKNGFWIESIQDFKTEVYYLHGIRNGIEKMYYRNGTLMAFRTFKNGEAEGIGYYFHEKGYLSFTVDYLGFATYKNENLQKGLFTIYKSDGIVQTKGVGLFREGEEELAEEIRIGKWKTF